MVCVIKLYGVGVCAQQKHIAKWHINRADAFSVCNQNWFAQK